MKNKDIQVGEKYLFLGFTEADCFKEFNQEFANRIVQIVKPFGRFWIIRFDNDKEVCADNKELEPIKE